MSALQQWYDYVDSLSRPVGQAAIPLAAAPEDEDPRAAAQSGLPRSAGETIDLSPRLRARRYLADLIAPLRETADCESEAELPPPAMEPGGRLALAYEPPEIDLPVVDDYLREAPGDPSPWDGNAGEWVRLVAGRLEQGAAHPVAAEEEERVAPLDRCGQLLKRLPDEEVAQHSYKKPFKETCGQMLDRLLDPPLTLEEAARLLGVCPTTVRRYTNRGQLRHYRTPGNQRRFRLSAVLAFIESGRGEVAADGPRAA